MRPGKTETFAAYSPFTSLKDFNEQIDAFWAARHQVFSKGEALAFNRLVRFCAKYPGVANAKIATIVAACTEAGGVSRATFERMLRKARNQHILKIYHTVRTKGGYSHNVYVFQRFDAAGGEQLMEREDTLSPATTEDPPVQPDEETDNALETPQREKNRIDADHDHTYTSDRVPKRFRDLVKCFFDSAETIENYAQRLHVAAFKACYHEEPDTVLNVGIDSFRQLIGKIKKGGVRDTYAYFYRICENKFADCLTREMGEKFEQALQKGDIPENHWLLW